MSIRGGRQNTFLRYQFSSPGNFGYGKIQDFFIKKVFHFGVPLPPLEPPACDPYEVKLFCLKIFLKILLIKVGEGVKICYFCFYEYFLDPLWGRISIAQFCAHLLHKTLQWKSVSTFINKECWKCLFCSWDPILGWKWLRMSQKSY